MDRFFEIKKRLLDIAKNDKNIYSVIVIGSSARTYLKADEYSDLDLIILCKNPDEWIFGEQPSKLGDIKMSFVERTIGGCLERRILYDGSLDVDFIPFTAEDFDSMVEKGIAKNILNRGYDIIYDFMGIAERITLNVEIKVPCFNMSQKEFINNVNDFWFHIVWASKKILRGELWTAKMCVDSYLKSILLKIIEFYEVCFEEKDVWHNGRFLEKWADDYILNSLKNCFAHYEKNDIISVLINTSNLFSELSQKISKKCEYIYPIEAEKYARLLLNDFFGND